MTATAETSEGTDRSPEGRRWPPWLFPTLSLGAVLALPFWGMWIAPGPPMEEGFMLVFPERVLAGDVPNRDFLHLYGPGSLWVLAGAFKVLGVDLWVERLVGLGQIVGVVSAVAYVGHRWGRLPAVVGGATVVMVIMPAIGLTALAWVGGLALGLWAVVVAVRALDVGRDERFRRRTLVLGGVLAGFALLYRPDLVVALGLPLGALWLWGLDRPGRRALLIGAAAGVSPFLIHMAWAGPMNAVRGMVLEPVFDLRAGRSLGFPPSWSEYDSFLNKAFVLRDWPWPLPMFQPTNQIFLWVPLLFLSCGVLLAIGIYARRAGSPEGWRLLALALFVVGTMPQAVQRPDSAHLAWVSAVPFGLWPLAVTEWLRLRRPDAPAADADTNADTHTGARSTRRPLRWPSRRRLWEVAAPGAMVVALFAVIPNFTVSWYADYVGQTFGYRREGHTIEHRGRTFYHGREKAVEAVRELLVDVEQVTEPGDKLIVGPGDFTYTPYSEVHLYFLLPQLEPGTHYIEMDPGVANAPDSGLADELRAADVVILSTLYDDWDEPNASQDPGSPEPDRVLAEEFCLHETYGENPGHGRGLYELFLRCDP